jgi:large subunit ribosomal protein L22
MSPTKLQPIADLVRGKDLEEALNILKFTPGKGSELVEKVVKSAAANAENNHDMNPDNLYVAEISINQGPTMKRYRAASHGRAAMIFKRSSHIGVTLKERD